MEIWRLSQTGDWVTGELLDKDVDVRESATWALGKIGDNRAVDVLIKEMKDADVVVRRSATCALGKIGDELAIEPLIEGLKEEEVGVSYYAARR